ncbi:MAG: inosine/xanthosine triphosphatase [Patescibacteria group bacterium]
MRIIVGTKNEAKLEAVRRAVREYPLLANAEVIGVSVKTSVPAQPMNLEETIRGAADRARAALMELGGDYGVGLESGLIDVPYTKTGHMDTTACAIWDGTNVHLGLSSCFEYQSEIIAKMKAGLEATDAAVELGYSKDGSFRENLGIIGVLTKNRITRIDYSYQALQTALIHLENAERYNVSGN